MTLVEQRIETPSDTSNGGAEPGPSGMDVLFDGLVRSLQMMGDRELIRHASRFEQRLEAERLTAAARLSGTSGDPTIDRKRARNLLGGNGRSRRSTNRDARRAATLGANPALADKITDESIAPDSLDALGKAVDPDTGAIPTELIDDAAGLTPDQTNHLVDRWLEDTVERDAVNDRYRRQMQARRCRRGFRPAAEGKPALATLTLEGPDAVIDRVWNQITNAADAAYQAAGGRDHPVGDHTPWEHRLFDAVIAMFGDTAVDDSAAKGAGSTLTRHSTSKPGSRPKGGSKPVVVVSIALDDLGVGPATQHGTGPIADDLFARYVATSPIYVLFTDATGQPLWLGRTRRHATTAQFLTLTVRDGGCVRCGTAPSRCQAHHLTPWNAPAKGSTDIDNLALLCPACHRQLHRLGHTLIRRSTQGGRTVWDSRPTTPDETPPPQPARIRRE